MNQRIAIIGAGPAGCALACMLAKRGIDCIVFDNDKRPDLLVGESLIPAAIPIIKRLGIEKEVAAISMIKKGAALRLANDDEPRVDFHFQNFANTTPDYAYNIPRPEFDNIVRQRAKNLGVKFIRHQAQVMAVCDDPQRDIVLKDSSLSAAGLNRDNQPDLLIDASGRARLFSRCLNLTSQRGTRNDVAHFAHFKHYDSDSAITGQVVISILDCGWSWQIPLAYTTSVGVVLNSDAAAQYGDTAEQRLLAIMKQNKAHNKTGYERVSDVKSYANYQLLTKQSHGNGWVLLGDALGFVDPMLSPGVFMALESASMLDKAIFKSPVQSQAKMHKQLDRYYASFCQWHQAWSNVIEYFYDGRLLSLGKLRPTIEPNESVFSLRKIVDRCVSRVLSALVSGAGTRSKLKMSILYYSCQYLIKDPEMLIEYSIKKSPAHK